MPACAGMTGWETSLGTRLRGLTAECAPPRLAQDPQPDRISVRTFDLRANPCRRQFRHAQASAIQPECALSCDFRCARKVAVIRRVVVPLTYSRSPDAVIPAQAVSRIPCEEVPVRWMAAFAGMTGREASRDAELAGMTGWRRRRMVTPRA
jgi:hypothetical protein